MAEIRVTAWWIHWGISSNWHASRCTVTTSEINFILYEKEIDSCNFDGTVSNVVSSQHYDVSVFVVKENGSIEQPQYHKL